MSVLDGLVRLARALAVRRALALLFGALAVLGAAAALAAAAAQVGLLAAWRWLPLLLWVAACAGAVWVLRAVGRAWTGGPAGGALHEAASVVETEQALRRGSVRGVVDLASAAVPGTSPVLAVAAARRVAVLLPDRGARAWAPAALDGASVRVRRRGAAAAAAALAALVLLWRAGDAAATLRSPVRAWRAALRPVLALAVSAASVRPGEGVTVRLRAEPGTRRVALYLRATGEPWRPLLLEADPTGRAAHRLPALRGTTWLYATAGGAVSETLQVRLVRPLVVGDLAVTARYPAYLEREDEELDAAAGALSVPAGTVLALRGAASAALTRAALAAGRDTVVLRFRGATFEGELVARASAAWRLLLAAPGLGAPPDTTRLDVIAVADSAPVVTVPVPGADTTAPLDLRPTIVIDARDDHGLARAAIVSWRVSRLGVAGDTAVDSLPGVAGADRVVLTPVLELSERGLLPGDTLRFFVRAADRAPLAHVGRSREYAIRLRSMAELREAARVAADSLARDAAQLARDQAGAQRQTEDLAAQRNRAGDRTVRPPEAGRPDASGVPPGAAPFEQQAEAQRVLEQQQALLQRAESLHTELQQLVRAAEDAGLNDPAWQQQLRDLAELLRQAVTPEMQRSLEELRRALEQLDPRAMQEALRRLAEQQRALREELQRSVELFERAAIEGSMQTFARQAEELEREQREWADRAEGRRDTAAAAAEEERLRAETDSLRRNLGALGERLAVRGDSATQSATERAERQVGQAALQMAQAAQAMQQGERAEASREGRRAAESLAGVPRELDRARERQAAEWRSEVLRMLGRSTQETVELAMEEQRLAEEVRSGAAGTQDARGRQAALEQGIGQVLRQLQQSAGRHALIPPRLGASLAQARDQARQSREAMEGPSPSPDEAARRAAQAAQLLASAAMQMLRSAEDVAGAQSGSGFAEAVERLAQLAGQQGQLNDQLGGLLPLLGSGEEQIMLQLRQLAERQRRMAAELERLGAAGLPGRPEQLADEARQLADRMERGQLDRATLERQQRLFRRLLDAGRTLQGEDEPEEEERRSRTAEALAPHAPGATARAQALRFPAPSWESLKALTPSERAVVLDYFRRINAQPR